MSARPSKVGVATTKCPRCWAPLAPQSHICTRCGTDLASIPPPTSTPTIAYAAILALNHVVAMIVVALWIFSNPSLYLGALAVGTVTTLVFGLLENATLARSGHRPIMVVYRLRYSSQFSVGIFLIWFLLTPYYLWLRQRQIPSTRPLFLATLTLSLLTVAAACAWYMTHPPFPSS